jgi:hypothetical protein
MVIAPIYTCERERASRDQAKEDVVARDGLAS